MILTCPNCDTQYVVKDGAIPPEGRQVRCASCKHSWHQDPEPGSAETASAAEPEVVHPAVDEPASMSALPEGPGGDFETVESAAADDDSLAEATLIEPRSGPEAEQRAYEEAVIGGEAETPAGELATTTEAPLAATETDEVSPPTTTSVAEDFGAPPQAEPTQDDFSPFAGAYEDEPRRRGPLRTILTVALIIVALAALFWFLAPADLKAKLGIAAAGESPLALVTTHMDRQKLESGNELLTVTGRVINPTAKEQEVPALQAQLRSKAGKVVYSWTIAPPARSLPAGSSASFNSAEVNVPPGGDELTITLGDPRV